MRDYRQTPEGKAALARDKRRVQARTAAINRLIQRHKTEFHKLYAEMKITYKVDD